MEVSMKQREMVGITYSIHQVAEKTGMKSHVLRYYEKEGLLPCVSRTDSGIRRYTDDDLDHLGLIACLKNTGMSIKQIREFIELSETGDESFAKRCEKLIELKKKVEEDIAQMHQHLIKVAHKIEHFTKQHHKYCRIHPEAEPIKFSDTSTSIASPTKSSPTAKLCSGGTTLI